ncbi:ABC transporter substrate-binding protein [Glycomyces sp. TRM65418]|uniref:ABC transporter substrate-binding protein n=1 Tax=Glycomyces sp. TRM65418 TaxID=2867006 RepID=UPI001CE6EB0A|nr:ABC transporter substrate-binding protein [Glycomyces sp. TRM65418]MCC3763737.1 ABC transporter substrate-binding protein [Glycomyces sp. TRM65418]QZD53449.1 ABC transporter substrate-binding protein [Glycomyces sp. TRM65418]
MFKQVLAGVGAGALLLGLTACGGGDDSGDGGSGDGLVVGFAQVGAESAWRTANSESVKSAAEADDRIAELKFVDGQQEQEKQIEAIRNFITQQVDVIVLAPVVETGWTDVLQEAEDAGIPVVLADRGVEAADEDLYVTRLGSDFAEEGRKAGAWAVETFADDPDGTRILELQGTTGSAPANDRKSGFFEVLDAEGLNYELVDSQSGNFTAEEGKAVMETFITTHGLEGIDLLYAHNDEMGLGAIQAIEEAGFKPGEDIQIIIVDGSKAGFQAGVDGKLNYIVECNPVFGEQLMDVVVDVANGESMEKFTPVEEGVFDSTQFEAELPNRQF